MPSDRARRGPWVLVTAEGLSRGSVAAVRSLARSGYRPTVASADGLTLAAASRFCHRRVGTPDPGRDPDGFARAIAAESSSRPYLATLPATDAAMRALDHPALGLMSKVAIARRAVDAGLAVPPSQVFESHEVLLKASRELPYPAVVKPDLKRFMAQYVAGPEDLVRVPTTIGALVVQPFVPDPMRGVIGLMWQGRLVSAVHVRYLRIWPYPCGSMAAGVTEDPDVALESGLERLMADYDGLFHVDIAGPYLLDLNLRIHPLLALSSAAGVDLVPMYCRLLSGGRPQRLTPRRGIFFRWIEGDVRAAAQAVARGRSSWRAAARALRPQRGTIHGYEALTDPGPVIARLALAPRQLRERQERRRAAGVPAGPGPPDPAP